MYYVVEYHGVHCVHTEFLLWFFLYERICILYVCSLRFTAYDILYIMVTDW